MDFPLRITEKVQPACLPPDEMVISRDAPCTPGISCNGITQEYQGLKCYYTGWNLRNKTDNILR